MAAEHRHGGGQPSGRPTPRLPPLLVAVGGQPELLRPLVAHLLSAPAEGPAAAPAPGWGDACADVVQQLYLALPGAVGDAVQQVRLRQAQRPCDAQARLEVTVVH